MTQGGPVEGAAARIAAGRSHLAAGRTVEAGAAFEDAVTKDPRDLEARLELSSTLITLQRFDAAEQHARAALAIRPGHPAGVRTLSSALQLQGRYADGLAFAGSVLASQPTHGEAWMAHGDSLANLGRPEEAIESYLHVLHDPQVGFDALVRTGMMQGALGRGAAAIGAFDAALALNPDAVTPRFQRGLVRLALHDFAAGWDDYEARWRSTRFVAVSRGIVPQPIVPMLATGPSAPALAGRRVMLISEQGIGDAVMFSSMIPDLARTAASVECVCDPRLVRLFSASFEGVAFTPPQEARIDTDVIDDIVAMGSLGGAFRRRVTDFPGTPYLRLRREVRDRWAARLGPREKRLRIGLSWRGGTAATIQHSRSVSLDSLAPILGLPDCEFVSLQYGEVTAEVAAANVGRENPIRLFPKLDIDDFEELAGLVMNLDVIVSVQTSLVHLSGALGQTCLTLVPSTPAWRYGASGASMPWYQSVRLFRQAEHGDWNPVVAEVAEALRDRLAAAARAAP